MKNRAPIIILIAVFIVFALMAAGCASTDVDNTDDPAVTYNEHNPDNWYVQQITLDDGRTVQCIVFYQYSNGGPAISCDFDGAVGTTNEEDSE